MEDCKSMLRELYIAFYNKAYTDNKIAEIDKILAEKEKEIMSV
jgi:ribosome recycling factor